MGVESFYITVETKYTEDIVQLSAFFEANNFEVTPYIKKFGGIFHKKVIADNDVVINNIVICSTEKDNEICFQACFSCYEKAIMLISDILMKMNNRNMIQYIKCWNRVFDLNCMNQEYIMSLVTELNYERLHYFQSNYTRRNIDLLPNEFYVYYNKHRRSLK